jgi:hypothetical protein
MASDDRDDRDELDEVEDETDALAEPDEKTFWNTYSPRHEMPISHVASALILLSFVGLLALFGMFALNSSNRKGAELGLYSGDDDSGVGTEGSGGVENPITIGDNTAMKEDLQKIVPNLDQTLPQVKEELKKIFDADNPNSSTPISDDKLAPLLALDEKLRDKLLGTGQKKGSGGPNAQGDQGNGQGSGGTGADSTRARSLRWIMRFKTAGGQDYLNQLSYLGAEVVVPLPPDNKQHYLFKDLANPKPGTMTTEKDWDRLAGQIQFSDYTRKSVLEVSQALNLDFTPKLFLAFFPRELEDRMSRMERGHQNRRSEDIEETVFEVIVRGGKYEIVVASQKLKR